MTYTPLSLPVDIPWRLLSASSDMRDPRFCDKRFPPAWRSSLAVYGYEPPLDELPESLSDQRVAILKVSATISGYQPSAEEVEAGRASFPSVPAEDVATALDEYFACYGALLNVAVFPRTREPSEGEVERYPHIVDFEPKLRDLYQVATDSGEVLTSSQSSAHVGKTQTQLEGTETGFKVGGQVVVPISQGVVGTLSSEFSRNRSETDQEQWTTQTDASRERREQHGATTQLTQMYNLLTGYYGGTNRAAFLVLPRPHVLQPTIRRTFVQGLRMIEGVQDFVLVVARPRDMEEMCVEAQLETGHFSETVDVEEPAERYKEGYEDFEVRATASGSRFSSNQCTDLESVTGSKHTVGQGWVIDRRPARADGQTAEPGHAGMRELEDSSNDQARSSLRNYNYQPLDDTSVQVAGTICGEKWSGFSAPASADFRRVYRVLTRSEQPTDSEEALPTVSSPFLITSRGLCACMRSADPGPQALPPPAKPPKGGYSDSIVDETAVTVRPNLAVLGATRRERSIARDALRQIGLAMTTSWRRRTRRPFGEVGFLDSDYFSRAISRSLPREHAMRRISETSLPREIVTRLGADTTTADALALDLSAFAARAGTSIEEAVAARRTLLGIASPRAK